MGRGYDGGQLVVWAVGMTDSLLCGPWVWRTDCCVGRGYDGGQLVVWAVGMTADSLLCGPWV